VRGRLADAHRFGNDATRLSGGESLTETSHEDNR